MEYKPHVEPRETWHIEAQTREEAQQKAFKKQQRLNEIGLYGQLEYKGIKTPKSETVNFKKEQTDNDVGAIHEYIWTLEGDHR